MTSSIDPLDFVSLLFDELFKSCHQTVFCLHLRVSVWLSIVVSHAGGLVMLCQIFHLRASFRPHLSFANHFYKHGHGWMPSGLQSVLNCVPYQQEFMEPTDAAAFVYFLVARGDQLTVGFKAWLEPSGYRRPTAVIKAGIARPAAGSVRPPRPPAAWACPPAHPPSRPSAGRRPPAPPPAQQPARPPTAGRPRGPVRPATGGLGLAVLWPVTVSQPDRLHR
jgi:hypothetical protein